MPLHKPPRLIRSYRLLWRIWKERRFRRFLKIIAPQPDDRLLDLGGYPFNWYSRGGIVGQVDVLNLNLSPVTETPPDSPTIRALSGDARAMLFPDCLIWTERIFWIFPKSHVAIRSNQLDLPA